MVGMGMQRNAAGNVVNTFKLLPDPIKNDDKLYFVKGKTFRHKRGFYYSDGKKWKKI